jgi:hypothetical protein
MHLSTVMTISRRAATVVAAVVLTTVIVSGTLDVAQAARAAIPNNSVNSAKIVDNSVASGDIRNETVAAVDIKNGAVGAAEIATGAVGTAEIADSTVSGADIATGGVARSDLAAGQRVNWAHVDAGTTTVSIIAGTGVNSVTRVGTGTYTVVFNSSQVVDASQCGITVDRSANAAGGGVDQGFITAAPESAINPNNVVVTTHNLAGAATDTAEAQGFTVVLYC